MTAFATLQAAYAAHKIATYPLKENKTPAVRAYDRIGASYSAQLAVRFPDATAAGFVAGPRNRVTVVDIDFADARLLDECLDRFGPTPLQIRSPSGGHHLYYRHNGETRRIKPLPDVDILGAGNVVAAGSIVPRGRYEIVRGSLEDLERLPRLADTVAPPAPACERVPAGKRNKELFSYCKSIVRHCDTLDQLLDAVRTWGGRMEQPADDVFTDAEIVKTATSAWRRRGGGKLFMQHIIEGPLFPRLIADPEVWTFSAAIS